MLLVPLELAALQLRVNTMHWTFVVSRATGDIFQPPPPGAAGSSEGTH